MAARNSTRLTGSMKREESQLVKIEDFYRRCLQARFAGRAVAVVRREKGADSLGSEQGTIKCDYRTLFLPGGGWYSSSSLCARRLGADSHPPASSLFPENVR